MCKRLSARLARHSAWVQEMSDDVLLRESFWAPRCLGLTVIELSCKCQSGAGSIVTVQSLVSVVSNCPLCPKQIAEQNLSIA